MKSLRMTAWPVIAALSLAAVGVGFNLEPGSNPFSAPAARAADSDALIPRAAIFGNPDRSAAQVSPDGKWISFTAPRDGVMNVYVAPFGNMGAAKPVTNSTDRPVRQYFWSADSTHILYLNDKGGDENFLIYAANAETGEEKALTPFENTRAFLYGTSWSRPDEVLVGLNNRDPKWHDLYTLNIKTGELTLVHENTTEIDGYVADDSFKVHFVTRATAEGGQDVFKVDDAWNFTPFATISADDAVTTGIVGLNTAGTKFYMIDSRDRNTSALTETDLATGETRVLGENAKADISGAIVIPETGDIAAFTTEYIKPETKPIGDAVAADIAFLDANLKGIWTLVSQSHDNNIWIILNDTTTEPAAYFAYDRTAQKVEKLFTVRPNLEGAPLSPMYGVEIPSRDGLTLVSYLTLPRGSDADGDGRPEAPQKLILNVHGGPWSRDTYGYDSEHQWMANRGYAVLAVNYRGSTGFGKDFINAASREWGGKMHDDLIDAVQWAIDNGITTADQVAIYGGSYGGYATLVGLTFTPTTFACGVDIVGVSNLTTFLNTIPPYWESGRKFFNRHVGDASTPEGLEFLRSRSPVYRASEIQRPLLIVQGANDPRVNKDESDQIANAMKASNIPVTYVLYPDEGHGFAKPANRTSFYAVSEAFLSQCLGGRFEPIGGDFAGSSLQIVEGIDYVPGLKEGIEAMGAQ